MDRISKERRSWVMSRIRSKNTTPEIRLRRALYHSDFRGYRIHYDLIGKPDIVFIKKHLAIFVDGDFWHGYLWTKKNKIPNNDYWKTKIKNNIERDKKYTKQLREEGWNVLRFWEHDINKNLNEVIDKISCYF